MKALYQKLYLLKMSSIHYISVVFPTVNDLDDEGGDGRHGFSIASISFPLDVNTTSAVIVCVSSNKYHPVNPLIIYHYRRMIDYSIHQRIIRYSGTLYQHQ